MAVWDVARGSDSDAAGSLLSEIAVAIRERQFAAVTVDSEVFAQPDLEAHHSPQRILWEGELFYPVMGMRTRPRWLDLPRTETWHERARYQ